MKAPLRLRARLVLGMMLRNCLSNELLLRIGHIISDEALYTFPNHWSINGENIAIRTMLSMTDSRDPLTILDVGANEGQWASILLTEASRFSEVCLRVHAFEPVKEARTRLEEYVATVPDQHQFYISGLAVSAANASDVRFHVRGDGSGISSLYEASGFDRVDRVESGTLDSYAKEHGLSRIHFAKIDAEGHDFHVLRGARSLLKAGCIDFLQFEYNWRWIDARSYLKDVFHFIADKPYLLSKVTPNGLIGLNQWWPGLEIFREGNYLLVRSDLASSVEFESTLSPSDF